MTTFSAETRERARKNLDAILEAWMTVDQSAIGPALGKNSSDSSATTLEARIEEFALLLAMLSLKVVAVEMRCVDVKTLEMLLDGHRKWVESLSLPGSLKRD